MTTLLSLPIDKHYDNVRAIEKRLDKHFKDSGFYSLVKITGSCVCSRSFYIDIQDDECYEGITIRVSDHASKGSNDYNLCLADYSDNTQLINAIIDIFNNESIFDEYRK